MTNIDVTDEAGNSRTITPTNINWMLFTGWMFYIGSLFLNFIYYLMHPSSPEMWTWGAAEKLEEWTPLEEKETEARKQINRGQQNQLEASQIELAELLPQDSNSSSRSSLYSVKFKIEKW